MPQVVRHSLPSYQTSENRTVSVTEVVGTPQTTTNVSTTGAFGYRPSTPVRHVTPRSTAPHSAHLRPTRSVTPTRLSTHQTHSTSHRVTTPRLQRREGANITTYEDLQVFESKFSSLPSSRSHVRQPSVGAACHMGHHEATNTTRVTTTVDNGALLPRVSPSVTLLRDHATQSGVSRMTDCSHTETVLHVPGRRVLGGSRRTSPLVDLIESQGAPTYSSRSATPVRVVGVHSTHRVNYNYGADESVSPSNLSLPPTESFPRAAPDSCWMSPSLRSQQFKGERPAQ